MQVVQALVVEPGRRPPICLTGTQVPTPLLDEQAEQSPPDVLVDLAELDGRIPGAEVVAPAPQELVQPSDDDRQLHSDLASIGDRLDLRPGTFHGTHRWPAL